jgi:hypothetical protein
VDEVSITWPSGNIPFRASLLPTRFFCMSFHCSPSFQLYFHTILHFLFSSSFYLILFVFTCFNFKFILSPHLPSSPPFSLIILYLFY